MSGADVKKGRRRERRTGDEKVGMSRTHRDMLLE